MEISITQHSGGYKVVNETAAKSPKAKSHPMLQPKIVTEVQLWLRTEKGDIRMGTIHSGLIQGVVESSFNPSMKVSKIVVGCREKQIFYCAVCLKLSPKWFLVPNEEWKKYVIPQLQDKVICRPCYDELKETFPSGWKCVENEGV